MNPDAVFSNNISTALGLTDKTVHDTDSLVPHSISTTNNTTSNNSVGVPQPNGTYMIRNINSGEVLTTVAGHLTLAPDPGNRGGCHWVCMQHPDGWIQFRNIVTGGFLALPFTRSGTSGSSMQFFLQPREPRGYTLYINANGAVKAVGVTKYGAVAQFPLLESPDRAPAWDLWRCKGIFEQSLLSF
ncbi:hypothetical protein RRF57_000699 [Xylaria bambusicola]|uniref:Ricin B lectin domain-containing protein n=1 Tax=Xylaria bambusicola TaxID=326684 RepID=A0AAN7Z2S4_9PEZI